MRARAQGKKVSGRRCGIGDRGAAVLRPDQAMERTRGAHPSGHTGRDVAALGLANPGKPFGKAEHQQRERRSRPRRPTRPGRTRHSPTAWDGLCLEAPARSCRGLGQAATCADSDRRSRRWRDGSSTRRIPNMAAGRSPSPRATRGGAVARALSPASAIKPVRGETAQPVRAQPTSAGPQGDAPTFRLPDLLDL